MAKGVGHTHSQHSPNFRNPSKVVMKTHEITMATYSKKSS